VKLSLLVAGLISFCLVREPRAQDPEALLAAMRAALGGDALQGVEAFTIGGKLERHAGPGTLVYVVELTCQLPDRCVRRTRPHGVPSHFETTMFEGFTGEHLIFRIDRPRGAPAPPSIPPQAEGPESGVDPRAAAATRFKEEFGRLQLVLFASSPATYPVRFAAASPDPSSRRKMDAIEVRHEEFAAKLMVDAATHLPAALAWTAPPIVVSRGSRVFTTSRGTVVNAPALPDGPRYIPPGVIYLPETPTPEMLAELPPVEHRLEFSQFKTSDGITWPRRIVRMTQGHVTEVWRLEAVKINPRIDRRWFESSR